MNSDDPASSESVLLARYEKGRYIFRHANAHGIADYRVPDTCRGYTIAREVLERAASVASA